MDASAIHISEIYNRNSILKNGLFPTKVNLDHHLESFRENGYLPNDETKILYTWKDCNKNEKFIRDMIYCKTWLHPRNNLAIGEEEDYIDFRNIDMNNLYPYKNMIYDVYKIENFNPLNSDVCHVQEPDDSIYNTCYEMDDYYSHNDKVLLFSKKIEKNIKIIGQASLEIIGGKIITKIFKNIRY